MTEFERKVLEYLAWRKDNVTHFSKFDWFWIILLAGAVISLILEDIVPLFLS